MTFTRSVLSHCVERMAHLFMRLLCILGGREELVSDECILVDFCTGSPVQSALHKIEMKKNVFCNVQLSVRLVSGFGRLGKKQTFIHIFK